jgi:hypothetical protein
MIHPRFGDGVAVDGNKLTKRAAKSACWIVSRGDANALPTFRVVKEKGFPHKL